MNGRVRPLAGVLAATAVALTGTRVSAVALPWYVLGTTGSAAWTGVVAFAEMVPYVLVKALTGPLVDHVGPRRISLASDVVSAAAAGAVVLLHTLGALPILRTDAKDPDGENTLATAVFEIRDDDVALRVYDRRDKADIALDVMSDPD